MSRVDLVGYLDHMHEAATLARGYVAGMTEVQFLSDKKTQQAVIFNIVVLGRSRDGAVEEAWRLRRGTPQIPWRSIKDMRNRIAHVYFDINLDVVWRTVKVWVPELLAKLPAVRAAAVAVMGRADSP